MNDYVRLLLCFFSSFLLCFINCKVHLLKFVSTPKDQIEVEELNPNHKFKSCGGVDFLLATLCVFILFTTKVHSNKEFILLIFTALYYGLIGFIDDFIKIKQKDNHGLSGYLRIILEIFGVAVICKILSFESLRFINLKFTTIHIGSFALLYAIICVLGCCNGINLTDGLDGLATITYILAISPFLYIAIKQQNILVSIFICCLLGSLLAYLCFNFNPSKLIMGDVGSLSLGAIIAVCGLSLNFEVLILISGLIYIIEAISVILQVSYFKITHGKRILKMAPLHYHFLKSGMKESNVVLLFTILGIFLSIIATIIGVI